MALTLALKKLLPFTLQLFTGLRVRSLRRFLSRMFNFQFILEDWLTVWIFEAHFRISMTQSSWYLPWRSLRKSTPLKVILMPLWIWNTFNHFPTGRLNQSQREELALIEQAYDNPHDCQQSSSTFSDLSNVSWKVFLVSNVSFWLSVPLKSVALNFLILTTSWYPDLQG